MHAPKRRLNQTKEERLETLLTACVVGFIAYIAGRGMVGTKAVTTEHAQAIAMEMYERGRSLGRVEGVEYAEAKRPKVDPVGEVRLLDEYINGFSFAMKAFREHGDQAEAATKGHIAGIVKARNEAVLTDTAAPSIVRL
jgi:hypothetical protein